MPRRSAVLSALVLLVSLLSPAGTAHAAAASLAVSPASTVIGVGGFELMHAELFPAGPSPADWAFPNAPQFHQEDVVWLSSDPNIAPVVTTSGTVYGRAAGTATITATLGTLTATSTVTVAGTAVNNVVLTPIGPRPYRTPRGWQTWCQLVGHLGYFGTPGRTERASPVHC